jgi:ketosteroid isomerase-like protein
MKPMSTSRTLLNAFFDCLRNLDGSIDKCVDLFADDGVFEFPYFSVLGMPTRFQGKAELRQVLEMINAHFSGFTLSNIEIHEVKEGDALFVRYHSDGFIDRGERNYAQDYVSHLIAENGKIKILREYLNVINTARMLFPNGLADVPPAQS